MSMLDKEAKIESEASKAPGLAVAVIKNGRYASVGGGCAIVSRDDTVLLDLCYDKYQWVKPHSVGSLPHMRPSIEVNRAVVLDSESSDVYAHWTLDLLPRLLSCVKVLQNIDDIDLWVIDSRQQFQVDALKVLGIDVSRARLLPPPQVLYAERLYTATYPFGAWNNQPWLHKEVFKFGAKLHVKGHYPSRIYISRSLADKRRIVNEDELASILAKHGVEIVNLEEMSLSQQVSIFRNVTFVCGPHGAGFTNLVFTPQGCKVLDIMPANYTPGFFHRLCIQSGHSYSFMICEPVTPDSGQSMEPFRYNIRVDVKKFAKCLEQLLS